MDEALVKEQLNISISELMQYREEIIAKANSLFAQLNAG